MDKRWAEDVKAINEQQLKTMASFEAKCRSLYEERLANFMEQMEDQISQYEGALLDHGAAAAEQAAELKAKVCFVRSFLSVFLHSPSYLHVRTLCPLHLGPYLPSSPPHPTPRSGA